MKMTFEVEKYASASQSSKELFAAFLDYWHNYRELNKVNGSTKTFEYDKTYSLDEKEARINAALKKEILSRANIPYYADRPVEEWFTHPNVIHETFAVVGALIDMILPESIIETIGVYSDVKIGGWGDSFKFDIKPRDLWSVSLAGHRQRKAEIKKQFSGQVTVVPDMHQITVGVSLYRVLAGMDSLADLAAKAVLSIETQMSVDVYNLFVTTMAAVDATTTTGLYVSGYSQDSLVDLCQRVTAWNFGAKAVIVGTQRALVQVFPDDTQYRYDIQSDYIKLGYLKQAFGYDMIALPQVADIATPFGAKLSNSYLWIISPSSQKPIKLCLEGNTLSNTTGPFDAANLTQSTTFWKAWAAGVAVNAVGGTLLLP
jgi:hypothetical protein